MSVQEILECWLEHGDLSIVARRKKARFQDKYRRHDRLQENPPWMVTMCLSGATVTVRRLHSKREKLGKLVGKIALGFQMRDVPLHITSMMTPCILRINAAQNAFGFVPQILVGR